MSEQEKKSLISKRDEAIQKAKQLEADLYFIQGYIKALDEVIADSPDEVIENES